MADDLVPPSRRFGARHRAKIQALAEFLVRAREIADDTTSPPEERITRLRRLVESGPGEPVARLVQGFQKDATAKRFHNWSELIGYCRFAAAPIGQFLVELHGEDRASARAAESLFTAKHILRRIQRSKADYIGLDRIYLPGDWMRRAGVEPAALGESRTSPNLRRVFDQALDGVDDMIVVAGSGLAALSDRQFRIAMQTELVAVRRFATALRRSDPLSRPVSLSRPAQLLCVLSGHARGFWPAAGRA